jgi:leucyl-tRNA synthetase
LYDIGAINHTEPFKRLQNQGLIIASDGRKMSKRWGNVVNPDDIVDLYGADTLRVYEMFMGPFDQSVAWNTDSIIGSRRFLERVWRITDKLTSQKNHSKGHRVSKSALGQTISNDFSALLHKTIKKVGEDIEAMSFNTAVSSMMILVNEMEKAENILVDDYKIFLQILAPFAPHMTDEIWQNLGEKKSIYLSKWPKFNKNKIVDERIKIPVSVNGKVRAEIIITKDMNEEEIKAEAKKDKAVLPWIMGKEIKRIIYVPNRILNIVV